MATVWSSTNNLVKDKILLQNIVLIKNITTLKVNQLNITRTIWTSTTG